MIFWHENVYSMTYSMACINFNIIWLVISVYRLYYMLNNIFRITSKTIMWNMCLHNCFCTLHVFDEQCSLGTDSCEFLLNISYWTLRTIGKNVHIKLYETERRKVAKQNMKKVIYKWKTQNDFYVTSITYLLIFLYQIAKIYRINITYKLVLDNIW